MEVQSQYPDSAKDSHAQETTASTAAELLKHWLRRGTACSYCSTVKINSIKMNTYLQVCPSVYKCVLYSYLQDSSSSDESDDESKSRSKGWAICTGASHEITLSLCMWLTSIDPAVLCVGLVQTLTRAPVQEVARLTLQQRSKRTVTSPCQTMSPVTKSRAENLQTSTVFTLILIYLKLFHLTGNYSVYCIYW